MLDFIIFMQTAGSSFTSTPTHVRRDQSVVAFRVVLGPRYDFETLRECIVKNISLSLLHPFHIIEITLKRV